MFRVYNNYRVLNNVIVKDRTLLPLFNNLMDIIGGAKYFIILDLCKAFHYMRIREGDK